MTLRDFLPVLFFCCLTFYFAQCGVAHKSARNDRTERMDDREQRLRQDIVRSAQRYKGTKYQYAGRQPGGFDCSGLICYVMSENGLALDGSSATQEGYGRSIRPEQAQAGDLIFFRRSRTGRVFHVALVVANEADGIYIIHATSSRGVVIDNLTTNSYWSEKFMTARDVVSE